MGGGGDRADRPIPWRPPPLDSTERPGEACATARRSDEGGEDDDRARRLVEEAQGRADDLLEEASREAERIREQARVEVMEEMRGRLETALEETVRGQVEAFEGARAALLAQIREAAEERMEQIERDMAGLVSVMAGKVIQRRIADDDDVVRDVVRATIEQAAGAKRFTVRVSPAEEDAVRAAQAELLSAADSPEDLAIVADDVIGAGGCIIETERGRFDARISTQLELLEEEMGRVLGE